MCSVPVPTVGQRLTGSGSKEGFQRLVVFVSRTDVLEPHGTSSVNGSGELKGLKLRFHAHELSRTFLWLIRAQHTWMMELNVWVFRKKRAT